MGSSRGPYVKFQFKICDSYGQQAAVKLQILSFGKPKTNSVRLFSIFRKLPISFVIILYRKLKASRRNDTFILNFCCFLLSQNVWRTRRRKFTPGGESYSTSISFLRSRYHLPGRAKWLSAISLRFFVICYVF